MKNKAFTLIELLIVIGIIAILAAAVIIAINPGQQFAQARNSTRENHANSLSNALLSYSIGNQGNFPTEVTPLLLEICNTGNQEPGHTVDCNNKADLSTLVPNYINSIPSDPRASTDTGTGYYVATDHTQTNITVVQGLKEISCEEGYVGVPGNPMYGTQDFCVMKYEAKCEESATGDCGNPGTNLPVSQAAHTPWHTISQVNSKNRCEAIGAQLITNNQWMTIARNIEAQPQNWTNGAVGSGSLFRGRSNSTEAADASDPLTGVNTRTHTLSNGEVIWDIAGNVWNWTDNTIDATRRPVGNGTNWVEWTTVTDYGDLNYNITRSSNSTWNSTQGVGRYYEGAVGTGDRVFGRGGDWYHGTYAGVFTLNLYYSPSYTDTYLGFRCSR
jgi:prepilin-type N-terminal cleavage/methylation domain-containing protein